MLLEATDRCEAIAVRGATRTNSMYKAAVERGNGNEN